jgi:transposase
MSSSKELELRVRVGNLIEKNPNMETKDIVRHFALEGYHRKTIYRIIDRLDSGQGVERKPGSGQYQSIDQKTKDKIIEFAVNEVGLSYRAIGRKFKINHKTVEKILGEAGVERKKRKCPKSSEKQKQHQKKCLEKLRRGYLKPSNGVEVIMDDESYFTTDGSDTNYNNFLITPRSAG